MRTHHLGFGQLETITNATKNLTLFTFGYDALGRRTTVVTPQTSKTTVCNGFGEVVAERDSYGEHRYKRDKLGRVYEETFAGKTARAYWDTAPNGIGRLNMSVSFDGVATSVAYSSSVAR